MLTKKEIALVAALGSSSFNNAMLMHSACVSAIKKAYGDPADKGELGQAIVDVVTVNNRIEVGRFMRKWGLNVTIDGKKVAVGAPRDAKKQAAHISGSKNDIAFFQLVDAHIKAKAAPKAPNGTVEEQAKDLISKLIDRTKKAEHNPLAAEVAAKINQMLQHDSVETEVVAPSTFVTKDGHVYELAEEEEEAMLNWLLKREVAKDGLKMAA